MLPIGGAGMVSAEWFVVLASRPAVWSHSMPYTTIALMNEVIQAHAVSDDLHAAGFPSDCISLVFPEQRDSDLLHYSPTRAPTGLFAPPTPRSSGTTGIAAGPVATHLEGIAITTVPGIGRLLATGPILTILSGVGMRASPDGMVRSLIGMGLPASDARHFTSGLGFGQILIAVRSDEESCSQLVEEIIRHHGGRDISQSAWPRAKQEPSVPASTW